MQQLHRRAGIFAGVYTLLQAVVYSIFSILGGAVYACLVDYPFGVGADHKVSTLVYLSYFKGKCRNPLYGSAVHAEAASASRTSSILLAYAIANAVWIPTSALLVAALVSRKRGGHRSYIYYPWIINTAALIVMDVIGVVTYSIDASKTLSTLQYEQFIGEDVGPIPNGIDGLTVVPAVILAGIFGRGVILWILNVIFFGIVIQAVREAKNTVSISEFAGGSSSKHIKTVEEPQGDQEGSGESCCVHNPDT